MVKSPVLVLKMPGKNHRRLSIIFDKVVQTTSEKTSDSVKLVVTCPQSQ
jgi:hypothetical protein